MNRQKKMTLLIMAAGIGSRYGGNKQLDEFGPNGETIMEYALYDACKAGFSKVVFVVREEIRAMMEQQFIAKIRNDMEAYCVVQTIDKFVPSTYSSLERLKPWGTAHAVLCAKEIIDEPFAVINADDFYGKASFTSLFRFLSHAEPRHHAMVGYMLKDVLSDHGSVSRGISHQQDDGMLQSLSETLNIVREGETIVSYGGSNKMILDGDLKVSMNSWGFMPDIFLIIEKMFTAFIEKNINYPKEEYYLALPVTSLIANGLGKVSIISGGDQWFGVTYREDKEATRKKIEKLVRQGDYPSPLWG